MKQTSKKASGLLLVLGIMITLNAADACVQEPAKQHDHLKTQQHAKKHHDGKLLRIEVAPTLVDCVGVAPMKCLQYRKVGSAAWPIRLPTDRQCVGYCAA